MGQVQDFDDIRPFYDEEVNPVLRELSKEPELILILKKFFPKRSRENIVELLHSFYSVQDFQVRLIRTLIAGNADLTTAGLSIEGLEPMAEKPNRLLISNHRDIILDSVYLNALLLDNGLNTCEIAIGNNLFVAPWIERLVRINKNIVVKRNVPVRQMLEISAKFSAYIRYAISEKKASIWLAQREGRAKDSNDRTQESLLKMLNISGEGSLMENMKQLNISPLTISYEYDPCDYLKAKEFQLKRDNPDYKKSPEDDILNMTTGLQGWKGHVHYALSTLDTEIDSIEPTGNKNDQIAALAKLIDKQIHKHYRIYPCNRIAFDMLKQQNSFANEYTAEEKQAFEKYLQKQLAKIDIPNKDTDFLQQKILEMYANPLINQLEANRN
jgi:hypothetical protein